MEKTREQKAIEALEALKQLIGPHGQYVITRTDHAPIGTIEAVEVGHWFELADEALAMPKTKSILLFAYPDLGSNCGFQDLIDSYETYEDALKALVDPNGPTCANEMKKKGVDRAEIWDANSEKILSVWERSWNYDYLNKVLIVGPWKEIK